MRLWCRKRGKRYIDSSTRRCAAVLHRRFSDNDPCQYMLLISKDVDMKNCEMLHNSNPTLLRMLKKKDEAKKRKDLEEVN